MEIIFCQQNMLTTSWSWSLNKFSLIQLRIQMRQKRSLSHQHSHLSIHDWTRQQWSPLTSPASIPDRSEACILSLIVWKLLPYPQDNTRRQDNTHFLAQISPAPGNKVPVCTIPVTTKTQRGEITKFAMKIITIFVFFLFRNFVNLYFNKWTKQKFTYCTIPLRCNGQYCAL